MEFKDLLPYIVTLLTSIIAIWPGLASLRKARKLEQVDAASKFTEMSIALSNEWQENYNKIRAELEEAKKELLLLGQENILLRASVEELETAQSESDKLIKNLNYEQQVSNAYIDHLVQIIHLQAQQITSLGGRSCFEPKSREEIESEFAQKS
jgi:hypothetical protein